MGQLTHKHFHGQLWSVSLHIPLLFPNKVKELNGVDSNLHMAAVHGTFQYAVQKGVSASEGGHH